MRSDWVLRRCMQLLPFLLIAVAAFFQARGVSALLGALLSDAGTMNRTVGALTPSKPSEPPPKSGRAILANNPFDSSARARAPEPELLTDVSDPLAWPVCEGVQVLIVTESSDPSWSLTTLRDATDPRGRLRRVGDGVAGKQVAFIGYNPRQQAPSVWLEGGGGFCQSMLFRRAEAVAAPPKATPGIARSSDTEVRVERAIVESALADPSALMKSVRVVPEKQDGAIVGLKLLGIKPGSLLGSVGLQNGDRLESINGFSMTGPEKALQAYAQLRTAERLKVSLKRRGQPVELTLNVN